MLNTSGCKIVQDGVDWVGMDWLSMESSSGTFVKNRITLWISKFCKFLKMAFVPLR
jgi:hypothetical protein